MTNPKYRLELSLTWHAEYGKLRDMETEKVKRVYEGVLQRHLAEDRQMIFIEASGISVGRI